MKYPLIAVAVAVFALSGCQKGEKPGDTQPVPKTETPIPTPTPVTAASTPTAAPDGMQVTPDPGKAAPATPAPPANGSTEPK